MSNIRMNGFGGLSPYPEAFSTKSGNLLENDGILGLPNELLSYLFGFLDVKDFCSIALVCKRWHTLTGSGILQTVCKVVTRHFVPPQQLLLESDRLSGVITKRHWKEFALACADPSRIKMLRTSFARSFYLVWMTQVLVMRKLQVLGCYTVEWHVDDAGRADPNQPSFGHAPECHSECCYKLLLSSLKTIDVSRVTGVLSRLDLELGHKSPVTIKFSEWVVQIEDAVFQENWKGAQGLLEKLVQQDKDKFNERRDLLLVKYFIEWMLNPASEDYPRFTAAIQKEFTDLGIGPFSSVDERIEGAALLALLAYAGVLEGDYTRVDAHIPVWMPADGDYCIEDHYFKKYHNAKTLVWQRALLMATKKRLQKIESFEQASALLRWVRDNYCKTHYQIMVYDNFEPGYSQAEEAMVECLLKAITLAEQENIEFNVREYTQICDEISFRKPFLDQMITITSKLIQRADDPCTEVFETILDAGPSEWFVKIAMALLQDTTKSREDRYEWVGMLFNFIGDAQHCLLQETLKSPSLCRSLGQAEMRDFLSFLGNKLPKTLPEDQNVLKFEQESFYLIAGNTAQWCGESNTKEFLEAYKLWRVEDEENNPIACPLQVARGYVPDYLPQHPDLCARYLPALKHVSKEYANKIIQSTFPKA